ncbi:RDD family protein [Nakamurella silvestris]|nr:RDD family protein [Nakamurella silvestris]
MYPGSRFGLPRDGAGSMASLGLRAGAFLIDITGSALIAWAFTAPYAPTNWSLLVWAIITVIPIAVFGQTPGQVVVGIRVAPLGRKYVGLWAVPRTLLCSLIVPAVITDYDGRGLHDRWCRTVVVSTR